MKITINPKREVGTRNPMIYGHFIEHFHRQIYDGVYDPQSPLADEDGLRTDVLEAMRKIKVPILRWPGGCFVSAYHWKDAVGKERTPSFDKAWRVEDPNTFGTDEYIKMCRKIGCEPYICTNAGTGTAEEMSDWVEYCNLDYEGKYAKWRIANGFKEPHKVKYWSVGNENYGDHEIGVWTAEEWGRLVKESCKMIKRVDPYTELSAAALTDVNWNINLLNHCAGFLDWISIHEYWDGIWHDNNYANYEQCMVYTNLAETSIQKVRGLLTALGLEKKIKIAFDEWNLRGWYHPNIHQIKDGYEKEHYLYPRDENDDNTKYTMADAVFTACFLNALNRNCDIVGMANFAPIVNTRGCIFTHKDGIVLRSTYHVFDLFVNYMGDVVLDTWKQEIPVLSLTGKDGKSAQVEALDILASRFSDKPGIAVSAVNKDANVAQNLSLYGLENEISKQEGNKQETSGESERTVVIYTVCGQSTESYNDVDHEEVFIEKKELGRYMEGMEISIPPHSVNVIQVL